MAKENESGEEKTEDPTTKRKEKALEEGNVLKSTELNAAFVLTVSVFMLLLQGSNIFNSLKHLTEQLILNSSAVKLNSQNIIFYSREGFFEILSFMLPFVLVIAASAVIINILQSGWNYTTKPLKPKFEEVFGKIFNPAKSLKKLLITTDTLVKLLRDLVKLLLIGWIGYLFIKDEIEGFIPLIDSSIGAIFSYTADVVFRLLVNLSMVVFLIAIIDFYYTKYKHKENLKMTKTEVKEERKQQDLSPEIKSKLAQKRFEIFMNAMRKEVPKADVVITNPIHVAVAIKYDSSKSRAPLVVAKGLRLVADKIKELANENNVPIVENPPLARSLYKHIEVGQEISEDYYKAIAEILAFVYRINEQKNK